MEPRITLITLGVADLPRAVRFYRDGLGWPTTYEEGGPVAFFETSGTRLALYPLRDLAADISPEVPTIRAGFSGITLAHNAHSKAGVDAVLKLAEKAGATIVKPAHDAFWGGYSGYFRDPDDHYWEVAWNPILPLDEKGFMNLRPEGNPPPQPPADGFSKVENALRMCLIAAMFGLALFIVGHGVKSVAETQDALWVNVIILAIHGLLAGIIVALATMLWRKKYRDLVSVGIAAASVLLNLFLMGLPQKLGLFEWTKRWAFDPDSSLLVHVAIMVAVFYLTFIFPFKAALWFYKKVSSLAREWLFGGRQMKRNITRLSTGMRPVER